MWSTPSTGPNGRTTGPPAERRRGDLLSTVGAPRRSVLAANDSTHAAARLAVEPAV
jgi:hypothetical protein